MKLGTAKVPVSGDGVLHVHLNLRALYTLPDDSVISINFQTMSESYSYGILRARTYSSQSQYPEHAGYATHRYCIAVMNSNAHVPILNILRDRIRSSGSSRHRRIFSAP